MLAGFLRVDKKLSLFTGPCVWGFLFFILMWSAVVIKPSFLDEDLWRLSIATFHFVPLYYFLHIKRGFFISLYDRLMGLEKKAVVYYLLIACLSVYLCGAILLRTFMFFFYMLPLLMMAWPWFIQKIKTSSKLTAVSYAFVLFTFVQVVAPGLYVPPFLDGINGWTSKISERTPVVLYGMKLVRDDGEEQWLSNAYADPAAFTNWTIRDTRDTLGDDLFGYYFKIYDKNYDLALQMKTPNQRYLGRFAYPGHNPYRIVDYRDFPPERIKEIVLVMERYDQHSMELKSRDVLGRYSITEKDRYHAARP